MREDLKEETISSEPIFMEGNCIYKMECQEVSKTCYLNCERHHKFDLREFIGYIYMSKPKETKDNFLGSEEERKYYYSIRDINLIDKIINEWKQKIKDLEFSIEQFEQWKKELT